MQQYDFNQIWNTHRATACSAALRYSPPQTPKEEIESHAMVGTWKAAKKFEEGRGKQLSSLIYDYTKWEVLIALRKRRDQTENETQWEDTEYVDTHRAEDEPLDNQILDMRLRLGYTFDEMGKELGVSLWEARKIYLLCLEIEREKIQKASAI